jgi:D-xylose transport system ATP-binding protein
MDQTPLVEMRDVRKAFGGVHAVEDVSVSVAAGEVLGIVGHNGAGKSTLIKILSGAHPMDSGEILIDGKSATINNPRDARSYGIETLYQDLALADNLDAAANLFLGRELTTRFGSLDNDAMAAATREVIARINPNFVSWKEPVLRLSGGQRQSIAIARAVHFKVKVLIMDEPTAALGHRESDLFKELVLRLKSEGIAMFMISHDINDVFDISDRIFVMAGGREVGTCPTAEVTKDEVLGMIILGKKPEDQRPKDLAKLH